MARSCSVCSHPDHLTIDAHLLGAGVERVSHREAAARWGLSRAAVQRHAASHVAPIMRAVAEQAGLLHAETMLAELGGLYERTIRLLDRAEAEEDRKVVLGAIREARATVETFAKVGLAMAQHHEEADARAGRPDLDALIHDALMARLETPPPPALPGQGDHPDQLGGDS